MTRIKRLAAYLVGIVIIAGLIGVTWSALPVTPDQSDVDPAVHYVNSLNPGQSNYRDDYFEHDGLRLHYVEAGQGDVVLFMHGFPSFWLSLFRQMDALSSDYRVVAIDGLGAGRSDAPRDVDAYRLETMSAHIGALLDHLGADQVHLVGHDWGAVFGMGFAQRFPERIKTVTGISAPPQSVILELVATNSEQRQAFGYVETLKRANPVLLWLFNGSERIWTGAYEPMVNRGELSAAEGDLFRQATSDPKRINTHINWYRANIPAFDKLQDADYWPSRKPRIANPALFIWGLDDPIITPAATEELALIADDLRLLSFENVGHWPHLERAEQVNTAIRELLAEYEQSNLR